MLADLSVANESSWRRIAPRPGNPSGQSLFSSSLKMFLSLVSLVLLMSAWACRSDTPTQSLKPRQLRDVPARRLAFNFQADVNPPSGIASEEVSKLPAIQKDFDDHRKDDALLRTV